MRLMVSNLDFSIDKIFFLIGKRSVKLLPKNLLDSSEDEFVIPKSQHQIVFGNVEVIDGKDEKWELNCKLKMNSFSIQLL